MYNVRLIQFIPSVGMHRLDLAPDADVIEAMQVRGYTHYGFNNNPRQRDELQGAPLFNGLLGPMWDGDAIRYEDTASFKILSESTHASQPAITTGETK